MKKFRWVLLLAISSVLLGCASNIKDGIAYLEEEKYEAAIACFEKDIEEEKNLDEAYRGAGIAWYELGDYEKAVDCLEHALENKAEKTATVYSLMAAGCLQLEDYQSALDYYRDALQMKDCTKEMEQEILFNEIAIYQKLGDWEILKEKAAAYAEKYPEDNRMEKTIEFLETR